MKIHNALFKLRQRAWLIPRDVKKLLVQALVMLALFTIVRQGTLSLKSSVL